MQRGLVKTIQRKVLLMYFSHTFGLKLAVCKKLSKKSYKDVTYNHFRHESTLNTQVHQKHALLLITDVYWSHGNESVMAFEPFRYAQDQWESSGRKPQKHSALLQVI